MHSPANVPPIVRSLDDLTSQFLHKAILLRDSISHGSQVLPPPQRLARTLEALPSIHIPVPNVIINPYAHCASWWFQNSFGDNYLMVSGAKSLQYYDGLLLLGDYIWQTLAHQHTRDLRDSIHLIDDSYLSPFCLPQLFRQIIVIGSYSRSA